MRGLVDYIRSLFCKHDWEMIFHVKVECSDKSTYQKKTYRCKKCGHKKSYRSN